MTLDDAGDVTCEEGATEEAERLARITALAAVALGDRDHARQWLRSAHPMMGGQSPIQVAASDLGARQVEQMLVNIAYGLPA